MRSAAVHCVITTPRSADRPRAHQTGVDRPEFHWRGQYAGANTFAAPKPRADVPARSKLELVSSERFKSARGTVHRKIHVSNRSPIGTLMGSKVGHRLVTGAARSFKQDSPSMGQCRYQVRHAHDGDEGNHLPEHRDSEAPHPRYQLAANEGGMMNGSYGEAVRNSINTERVEQAREAARKARQAGQRAGRDQHRI